MSASPPERVHSATECLPENTARQLDVSTDAPTFNAASGSELRFFSRSSFELSAAGLFSTNRRSACCPARYWARELHCLASQNCTRRDFQTRYNASQLQCIEVIMKTSSIPALRVSPELRQQAEAVLEDGETLSAFMLESLAQSIAHRKAQQDFVARGLASGARAKKSGKYVSADRVFSKLSRRLQKAKASAA